MSKAGKIIGGAVLAAAVVFTGGAAAAAFGLTTMGVVATNALVAGISTLALGGLAALTTKSNKAGTQNFGTKVAARGSSVPRQIVYGQCRVGGTITQMHSTGTDNVKLCMFVVLAGHRINGLVKLRINDVEATIDNGANISSETVFCVTNSDFTNTDNDHDFTDANSTAGRLIRFTFHDGQQNAKDGLARASLGSTFVPDTHIFTGCAYAYIEMIYDQDKLSSMPNFSFEVQGALVFDPRDNSTAYNDNPALCIRDYLTNTTYGLKCESSEINDAQSGGGFYSAAATCDTNVTLADNTTTTHTYFCGGFFSMADSGEEVLDTLLTSCAGNITYTNGKFNLFVGAAQTPSLTVTDSDILEPVTMQTKPANGNMYNQVKALFVDSTAAYKPTDTPIFSSSAFLTEDTPDNDSNDYPNYRKMMEIRLPLTTASEAAQRIARIALNQSRYTLNISVLVGLNFLKAQPHDWVYVTNERMGWTQKTFEIVSMNVEPIGSTTDTEILGVRLYLRETHADIYAFLYNAYTTPIASATGLATAHVRNVGAANIIDNSVNTNVIFDNAVTSTIISASSMSGFSSGSSLAQSLTISMVEDGVAYTGEVIVNAFIVQGSTSASGGAHGTLFNVYNSGTVVGVGLANVITWNGSSYVYTAQADSTMRLYLNPTSAGTNAGTNMTLMTSYFNSSIYTLQQPMTLYGRSIIDANQLAAAPSFTATVTFGVNNWTDPAFQVIFTVIRKFK